MDNFGFAIIEENVDSSVFIIPEEKGFVISFSDSKLESTIHIPEGEIHVIARKLNELIKGMGINSSLTTKEI